MVDKTLALLSGMAGFRVIKPSLEEVNASYTRFIRKSLNEEAPLLTKKDFCLVVLKGLIGSS